MKSKFDSICRFETIIVLLIIVAFSLLWINWGMVKVHGWDLPSLYRKMTKTTNTLLFFKKKESPHFAYFIYIVPFLGVLSVFTLTTMKVRIANFFLFLSCLLGEFVGLYMYYYLFSSKMFKLSNSGAGIHLLCIVSLVGIIYTFPRFIKKKKEPVDDVPESTTLKN